MILSEKEKKELLEKYEIKTEQLPRIFVDRSERLSRWTPNPGQIIKINEEKSYCQIYDCLSVSR